MAYHQCRVCGIQGLKTTCFLAVDNRLENWDEDPGGVYVMKVYLCQHCTGWLQGTSYLSQDKEHTVQLVDAYAEMAEMNVVGERRRP